jgi:hypothetical protein
MKPNLIFAFLLTLTLLVLASSLPAQPYYTNNSTARGAAQYNDALGTPLQPSAVIAHQRLSGVDKGKVAASAALASTNAFNVTYSAPPTVTASTSSTSVSAAITSVTTTNCIITTSATNAIVYWTAVGQ